MKTPYHSEQRFRLKRKEFKAWQSITQAEVSCTMGLNILQRH